MVDQLHRDTSEAHLGEAAKAVGTDDDQLRRPFVRHVGDRRDGVNAFDDDDIDCGSDVAERFDPTGHLPLRCSPPTPGVVVGYPLEKRLEGEDRYDASTERRSEAETPGDRSTAAGRAVRAHHDRVRTTRRGLFRHYCQGPCGVTGEMVGDAAEVERREAARSPIADHQQIRVAVIRRPQQEVGWPVQEQRLGCGAGGTSRLAPFPFEYGSSFGATPVDVRARRLGLTGVPGIRCDKPGAGADREARRPLRRGRRAGRAVNTDHHQSHTDRLQSVGRGLFGVLLSGRVTGVHLIAIILGITRRIGRATFMTTRVCGAPEPVQLVIFGDFNCPFSALASARVTALEQRDIAVVEWRAVDHDPTIPVMGEPVNDDHARQFEQELDDIRGLLSVDEPDRLRPPAIRVNTWRATAAYAATSSCDQAALRGRLFAAYWEHGLNLSAHGVVEGIAGEQLDARKARQWREEWASLAKPIVPLVVLPNGYVSRGLGALARLRQLLDEPPSVVAR